MSEPTTATTATTAERHYIYHKLARCVTCGSSKLKSYRSVDNGDGSRTKYSKCRRCGARLIIMVE